MRVCRFLRLISLSSYGYLQTLSIGVIMLKDLNLLLDLDLSWVILENINSSCAVDIELIEHFLLHCPQFVNESYTLLSTIANINYKLLENTDSVLTQTLLFGNTSFNIANNTKILNATINFILLTKRIDAPLFKTKSVWLFFGKVTEIISPSFY